MEKRKILIALLCSILVGLFHVSAQTKFNKANRKYDKWAYLESTTLYEKLIDKGYVQQDLLQKLADSYYFNGKYKESEKYYSRLINELKPSSLEPEYYFRYAHSLQNIGKDLEAKTYYDIFVEQIQKPSQIKEFRKDIASLEQQIKQNSNRYSDVLALPINTEFADYGSFVYNDTLYFASARDTGSYVDRKHGWTNENFTSIYAYPLKDTLEGNSVKRLSGPVKSKFNESSLVITKDGKTMYFTRNNLLNGKRGFDQNKNTNLKIYKATLENNKWANVIELPFNSDDFNTAHPSLNKQENVMYFSSDRPGGYGASDLWSVSISEDGNFGIPVNLGAQINSEQRETFPFINEMDELYFSSDARVGLGGLDIYVTKLLENGQFSEVQNLGEPINSSFDDFAYFIDSDSKLGFFSSNRAQGDDIYSFKEDAALVFECLTDVLVKIIDASTKQPIIDAQVSLYDLLYNDLGVVTTSKEDYFELDTPFSCEESYRIKSQLDGYQTKEVVFAVMQSSDPMLVTIEMEKDKIKVEKGDDLFKVLELDPIYFDLDKWSIRPDAENELVKILAVLEQYPSMKIDIRAHTDSRASHVYNDKLSQRRAESVAQWLVNKGIQSNRLTYKGYGKRQLLNKCSDGVPCSEQEHQENRRSEFIIIQM
ncbi:OmpA family protein [Myroides sp. LJL116]